MCGGVNANVVLHTADRSVAVDGRYPQNRRASVKEDLEGLRRSSNGDDSIVNHLERKEICSCYVLKCECLKSTGYHIDLLTITHIIV